MKAGLIGTGTIGRAVATGMARNGHSITVSRRNAENAAWLENEFPQVTAAENQDVVDNSEIVLIALTADVAVDALKALTFRDAQIVISLMSAFDLAQLAELVHPATPKAIMIPFPQIAAGGSPVLVLGDSAPVAHFFGASDIIISLDNAEELGVFLSAQAILSPAAVMVEQAAAWVESKTGSGEVAEKFLRVLIGSSLSGMKSDDLIEALNTPGGYNQRMRLFFENAGFHDMIKGGLESLRENKDG